MRDLSGLQVRLPAPSKGNRISYFAGATIRDATSKKRSRSHPTTSLAPVHSAPPLMMPGRVRGRARRRPKFTGGGRGSIKKSHHPNQFGRKLSSASPKPDGFVSRADARDFPRPVIGEIEALIDQAVDLDRPMLSRPLTGMQQHVLDDRVGALAVLYDLVKIALAAYRRSR